MILQQRGPRSSRLSHSLGCLGGGSTMYQSMGPSPLSICLASLGLGVEKAGAWLPPHTCVASLKREVEPFHATTDPEVWYLSPASAAFWLQYNGEGKSLFV